MHRIEAKYFDGQSSVSHKVILNTSERFEELSLQFSDGSRFIWYAEDLLFEQYGISLEIRNGKHSGALLQIKDVAFTKHFFEAMKLKKKIDVHHRILNLGFPKIIAIALTMFALIVLAYFYLLPPMAEKSAALLPESFDTYLGDLFMGTFLDENSTDVKKTAHLQAFADQIEFSNTKPLRFTVVNSSEINAFALPNGQIVVYSGLLNKMQSPTELAALLGHEAAHVNHRHSTKMLCRNLAGYLLISLILTDVNGIMAVLADNAHQLHNLTYSKKFEEEADEEGLKILMNNGIDPNGMVQLFALIEREEMIVVPKILSTHPLTKERKESMQEIIKTTEFDLLPQPDLDSLFVLIRH
jgi:beta-barrel assembly-enhancing protease